MNRNTAKRDRRAAERMAGRIAEHVGERERAMAEFPPGTPGRLVAATAGDFEEAPADLVAALGLAGAAAVVEGHTPLGHLIVASADDPQGFRVGGTYLKATYRALTVPRAQFAKDA